LHIGLPEIGWGNGGFRSMGSTDFSFAQSIAQRGIGSTATTGLSTDRLDVWKPIWAAPNGPSVEVNPRSCWSSRHPKEINAVITCLLMLL